MIGPVELQPAYTAVGVSPGDLVDVVRAEFDRTLKEAGGNQLEAFNLGIRRMHASHLVTDSDLKRLEEAASIIFSVEAGKTSTQDAVAALDTLYLDAIRDPESSAMGATMIGGMYSRRRRDGARVAGLMGLVVGGIIGGTVGAAIGGILLYDVAACHEDRTDPDPT
jgi:hypothetical protein